MTDDSKDDETTGLEVLPKDTRIQISEATTIATVGLNMALKYHDINTVQDGTLYQQFKLEGKNMHGLTIDDVLYTARQFEAHIMAASTRLGDMVMEVITGVVNDLDLDADDEAGKSEG